MVGTAAFHAIVRGSFPGLGLKVTKINIPHPQKKISIVGSLRSVLGLRPPGFAFRILCLGHSVISLISGGFPDTI